MRTTLKRIWRIIVSAITVLVIAVSLTYFDPSTMTVDAASLKHIDEIVAESGTFDILEIVPDLEAASFGYYIDGQEPVSNWKTTLAGINTSAGRTSYVNNLFSWLASKGILGSGTTTPLKYTYFDAGQYYTEAYTVSDPANWNKLQLNTTESVSKTGTFSPQENGDYRAEYAYSPAAGGGYVQNIASFSYTDNPAGIDAFFYDPVFSLIQFGTDLTGWENVTVYVELKDSEGENVKDTSGRNIYKISDYGTVGGILEHEGAFDWSNSYYYVNPTQTGAPGSFSGTSCYAAAIAYTDSDDAPHDGYTAPAPNSPSYFSRGITSYTYVGTGGNYSYSSLGGNTYTVKFNDIFYKAGFVNNNLFKQLILGLGPTNYNALNVAVTVRKASKVTQSDISAAEMIYLSTGSDITKGGVTTGYASEDIADACAVDIYNFAADNMPVIIDYPIVEGMTQSTPTNQINNIEKLCLLSLQSALTTTSETSLAALSVNWANLSYITSDADKTFVNNNIYCFDAFNTASTSNPANITTLVTQRFNEAFASSVYTSGFSAVLAEIQNENFLKQIAGQQDLLPENVTVSAAVRHIINFSGQRKKNTKTSIKVLDLQPAKVTSTSWLTANTVRTWINNTLPVEKITIVHMTTGEFIGKIEDINETYDMIYIGMSTESMNTSNGKTVYNDASMNELIYSGIGDTYKGNIEIAGIRNQDYIYVGSTKAISNGQASASNKFRFSGNDITDTKVSELKKYAQAGYPIVLADGFVSGSSINTNKVDNSSYMYAAVSGVYGTYANVMTQSFASNASNASTVIKYLNVSKPSVDVASKPVEYADDSNASIAVDPNDGYYYLKYVFSIDNITDPTPLSTTYNTKLYIDLNADGRFSDGESLNDIEVRRVSDGALLLPLVNEDDIEYYTLSADIEYQVTRQMPDSYVGIIPWKLEVVKNGADQIHASSQGYTRIAAGGNYQTVKVLQIMQAGTSGSKLNLAQQLAVNPSGSNTQLRGKDGKFYTGIYGKLIADLADFHVSINTIETNALEAKGNSQAVLDYLNGFDMLIIGFNDCYDGIQSGSASAIVSYINSGKSVLFTHDTTSLTQVSASNFPMAVDSTSTPITKTLANTNVVWNSITSEYRSIDGAISQFGSYSATKTFTGSYTLVGTYDGNVYTINGNKWYQATAAPFPQSQLYKYYIPSGSAIPNSITDWGYYFNTVIRDAVGLDRYGVKSSMIVNGSQTLGDIVNVNAPLSNDSITTILNNNRSVAFTPKSGKTTTVNEYQGYTNYALIRFAGSGNTYKYTNNTYSNRETTFVSQVNKGQITTYPYNVNSLSFNGNDIDITKPGGSFMQIGLTHEQYFQINMNTDDIVVWYCMSNEMYDSTNKVYKTDTSSYYDDVPNDCVNAYYIYNKGNVTYSGVGHSSNAGLYTGASIGQEYINEAKLFVNTMIAAYQSAEQAPKISIKKDARGTSDLSEKYMLTDNASVLSVDMGPANESRAVYYRISDPNVGVNKTITVQYYVSDDVNGTIDPTVDESQKVSPIGATATYNTNGAEVTTVKGGYVYKFYLPDKVGNISVLDQLKNENVYSIRVYVKVTTMIGSTALLPAVDYIDLKKQQLFELS